jgi:hypothetical protein
MLSSLFLSIFKKAIREVTPFSPQKGEAGKGGSNSLTPTTFFPYPREFLVNLLMGYRIVGDIPAAGAKATIAAVLRNVITIF